MSILLTNLSSIEHVTANQENLAFYTTGKFFYAQVFHMDDDL